MEAIALVRIGGQCLLWPVLLMKAIALHEDRRPVSAMTSVVDESYRSCEDMRPVSAMASAVDRSYRSS